MELPPLHWEYLLDEPSPTPSHAFAGMAALGLGSAQLLLPRGTAVHRSIGVVWLLLMLWLAVSSFFIHDLRLIGPFSPIHILSIYVLYGLGEALWHLHRGDGARHGRVMKQIFWFGLILAFAFTFLEGRAMNEVLTGRG
ncbi:MAG: DUF2306 domain-containing protein [Rubricella sp.]